MTDPVKHYADSPAHRAECPPCAARTGDCPRCGLNDRPVGSSSSALCTGCEWHTAAEALGATVHTDWGVPWLPLPARVYDDEEMARLAAIEYGTDVIARRSLVGSWEKRPPRCTCVPLGGFGPDGIEGPGRDCPMHGENAGEVQP